jgi:uncharacterized protein YlxW (UPF0749 family)
MTKERNDILKADKASKRGLGSGTETAEMSFKIRSALKQIKEDINSLEANVKKLEKKVPSTGHTQMRWRFRVSPPPHFPTPFPLFS